MAFSPDGKRFSAYVDEAIADVQTRLSLDPNPAQVRLFQGEAQTLLALKGYMNPASS